MMDTLKITWIYGLFVMFIVEISGLAEGNLWKKSLEKELLQNTIRYLRGQLTDCLRTAEIVRGKRKADYEAAHWLAELEVQMDIDILENTKSYLVERVVHCRKRAENARERSADAPPPVIVDEIYKGKVEKYLPQLENSQPISDVHAAPLEDAPVLAVGKEARKPEVKFIPDIGGSTSRKSSITQQTFALTTPQPDPAAEFILDGRSVTCDVFIARQTTLQCLNLRVDGRERLPNKDFCPPSYEADRWRSVTDMASRTRDVIDLLNLCDLIGQRLIVPGYTKDVSVVWGCDDIKPRLRWQYGRWDGYVEDNGFLHDLQCLYSADIVWPRP